MMGGGRGSMPSGSPMGSPTGSGATTTTGAGAAGQGAALFRSAGCGGCHTLAAAGTTGTSGPDLDQAHPSYEVVIERVTNGGGGMPAFAGALSTAQIEAIARYVAAAVR